MALWSSNSFTGCWTVAENNEASFLNIDMAYPVSLLLMDAADEK
jgi:hypothetical protein